MMFKPAALPSLVKKLFALPDFRDQELAVTGRLLTACFWMIMFFVTVNLAIVALTSPQQAYRLIVTILATDAIFAILLVLLKQGQIRLVKYLSIGVMWLIVTLFALTGGGVRAPSFTGYVVLTFLVGLALGGRAILVVAMVSGLSGLGMAYLENIGGLPASLAQFPPYTFWMIEFTFVLILAFMQYYASQITKQSLKRAQTELQERIRTEQALDQSEKRFRALIEQAPVAICLSRELHILYANPAFCELFGKGCEDDLSGTSFLEHIVPQCRADTAERLRKRDLGLPVETMYETIGLRSNGESFDLLAQVTRAELADGLATMAFLTDISQSKAVEKALRVSEEKFSNAFYNSPILMVISRISDGTLVEANQAFLDAFGLTRDEILYHSVPDLELYDNPADREFYLGLFREGQKQIPFNDLRGRTRNAGTILLSGSFNMMQIDGQDFALAVLENITELRRAEQALRESEERFHTLVEQAPVAIMISRHTQPIYANQALVEMLGYKDLKQVLSHSIVDYFMLTYPGQSRESITQHIIDLPSPGELEIDVQREDGTRLPVHIFIKTILLADGRANVSFIIDITERKQAEAQITASIQQLRALSAHLQTIREDERTHIAREIHDELGQALTGIKMDLFWLKNRFEKQQDSPQSASIINKLSGMVMETDLLIDDVRRISTDLRPSVLDTLGLVAAIEWLTRDFQTRSGVTCQFHTHLSSLYVPQDFSTAVFRICQESLTNVARHAQAGLVVVRMNLQRGSLVLTIDDDGQGITPEELRRAGSLGILGMKERAFSFNGQVDFEKSPQGGTRVIARFSNPPVSVHG